MASEDVKGTIQKKLFNDEAEIKDVTQDEISMALKRIESIESTAEALVEGGVRAEAKDLGFSPYSFEMYQQIADRTSGRDTMSHISWVTYLSLGLSEEVGEVLRHISHAVRDEGFCFPKGANQENEGGVYRNDLRWDRKQLIKRELGDVLWFVSQLAREVGSSLEGIAVGNNLKLMDRVVRKKINGEGDDR
jgi:NTP pyrophosphatase (non-canonical NTP hydrolase)